MVVKLPYGDTHWLWPLRSIDKFHRRALSSRQPALLMSVPDWGKKVCSFSNGPLHMYIFCTLEYISYRSLERALNICGRDHHNLDITTELKALVDVSGSKFLIRWPSKICQRACYKRVYPTHSKSLSWALLGSRYSCVSCTLSTKSEASLRESLVLDRSGY